MNTSTEYLVSTGSTRRLGDALGSVRHLTNGQGAVTLAKSYQPYGETLSSAGNGSSPFAFTGEQTDVSGMMYLRARYYSNGTGRFLYAVEHPDILIPLGSDYHGAQSHIYVPADVCPFR